MNVSIPHSLLLQVKQQLKLNNTFQQINSMPNMLRERKYLRQQTSAENFELVDRLHQRAKEQFLK